MFGLFAAVAAVLAMPEAASVFRKVRREFAMVPAILSLLEDADNGHFGIPSWIHLVTHWFC